MFITRMRCYTALHLFCFPFCHLPLWYRSPCKVLMSWQLTLVVFELVFSSEGLSRFLRDSALCLSELSAGLINVDGCKGTEKFWKVNQKKRMLKVNILQNAIYQHFTKLLPFLYQPISTWYVISNQLFS